MSDPIKPIGSQPDALKDALKAKVDAAEKVKALKVEAQKALLAAEKAKAEAEAILYADWKPGMEGTRKVRIPYANFVSGAQPKLNGKELAGNVDMTCDGYRTMMHQLSFREEQERCAKEGYFKGVQVRDVMTGRIKLVDAWDPRAEGLAGTDYKG